jgi:uncharacterized membrane protein required for colicin V production
MVRDFPPPAGREKTKEGAMNILDLALLSVLIGGAIYGSKVGFVRETTGVIALLGAIVIAVHYNDFLTAEMENWLKVSPMWASLVAFILAGGVFYAGFKFLARMFYRVAELQKLGRRDQFGGAIVGVLHGWFLAGFVVFMVLYLPLPYTVEQKIEESLLAVRMASGIPFVYEATAKLHPSEESFVLKLEDSLTGRPSSIESGPGAEGKRRRLSNLERARINDFLDKVERLFFADT